MPTDEILIQIVDSAFAVAARRSGAWLLCRPGCTQCCMGEFPITQLDALRLKHALAELAQSDPPRAARVHERVRCGPGDDDPCVALDPETGTCDLYAARPITCRTAGPPVDCGDQGLAVCELCYEGASDEQIAACAVAVDPDGLEESLLAELEQRSGLRGETTVTLALSA